MACLMCKNPVTIWSEPQKWIYGKQLELCHSCYAFHILGKPRAEECFYVCADCGKKFLKDYTKPWASICFECWKRRKSYGEVPFIVIKENLEKERKQKEDLARLFTSFRSLIPNHLECEKEKLKFLGQLEISQPNPRDVVTFEMYPLEIGGSTIKGKMIECPQYPSECKYHNTRLKIHSETRAEIDNLDFEKAVMVICETCLALMNKGYGFSVWYAQGQRSPHIIIYDFDEMRDFDGFLREQIQMNFWRDITPLYIHFDRAVWSDNHFVPLEYAPHWKHKTPFKMLFEVPAEPIPEKVDIQVDLNAFGGLICKK